MADERWLKNLKKLGTRGRSVILLPSMCQGRRGISIVILSGGIEIKTGQDGGLPPKAAAALLILWIEMHVVDE